MLVSPWENGGTRVRAARPGTLSAHMNTCSYVQSMRRGLRCQPPGRAGPMKNATLTHPAARRHGKRSKPGLFQVGTAGTEEGKWKEETAPPHAPKDRHPAKVIGMP
ncbi:hypothetical protein DA2_2369 [Desulfovibrio sp. A2]|nr:hypothetical protein DA2_2369 [Desulfovibrio sp. A2]